MSIENANVVQEVEEALAIEQASIDKRSEERLTAATKEREKISRIGSVLRYVGVAVLVAAMGTFMFQRWGGMSQVSRYFSFLAFTAAVCVSGLVCGLKIGENKGARTLLGVVVTLIPLHCAQIGAILYSRIGGGVVASNYPSYFFFSVPSLTDAIIVAVGGLVTVIAMASVAYSVLARTYAPQLLLVGCGVSAALLVPTRDPLLVAGIIAVAGAIAYGGERTFSSVVELRTREAIVARFVPFLALLMLVGRQCALYNPTSIFDGVVFALITVALFEMFPRLVDSKEFTCCSELLALFTGATSGMLVGHSITNAFSLGGTVFAPLVVGLPLVFCYAVMARNARETKTTFRVASAATLLATGGVELLGGSVEDCIVSLVIGILGVAYACIREQKRTLVAGGVLAFVSLIRVCATAITSITVSPWIVLGAIGVGTILGASYLERNFVRLREVYSSARKQVAQWS